MLENIRKLFFLSILENKFLKIENKNGYQILPTGFLIGPKQSVSKNLGPKQIKLFEPEQFQFASALFFAVDTQREEKT